jgi:hypothetical protein
MDGWMDGWMGGWMSAFELQISKRNLHDHLDVEQNSLHCPKIYLLIV